ncbi:MAG: DUF898 family protein [Enhydrobacter sp.]|nr:MAG: DUF898 family protein [Enhydrobacter sp.]
MTDASTAAAAAATTDQTPSRPTYDGRLAELYGIYLRHLLLMLLTLGWSRFWGRTRLRRYLWNHFSILGDRFEYRGRGIELFIGFLIVLAVLALWGGGVWLIWEFSLKHDPVPGLGLLNIFSVSVALIGIPLAFVGHYAGLRYRLSRTRWRGIRCGLDGSAWAYGARATFLTFANATTLQLLLPVVSVNLARPRIGNTRFGTQLFEFAGQAGDIYGRYVGYYFLHILAWGIAVALAIGTFGGIAAISGVTEDDLKTLGDMGNPQTILLIAALLFGLYVLFGLLILPLRCWWQAYLIRYLVSRTRAGEILFASAITTRQMWGFMVVNYLIVLLTLGLGWPWVMHRTLRLIASQLWIYGTPDGATIRQPPNRGPRYGEGLLEMFDVSGI